MKLARRLEVLQPSATLVIAQRAAALRAEGVDILSFSLGEPDFEPPAHVLEAAKRAIEKGASKYTDVRGVKALRDAICADSLKRRGVASAPDEVVVSAGAKHSLFNLAFALYDSGDEVIIPAPYWVSYPEQVRLAGAVPVFVETKDADRFLMSPEGLARAITKRTRALVLCSPSNPTGFAYSAEELRALVDVARAHDFWIIVDEIYGRLVYGGFQQSSVLTVAPELKDRIIVVDGVSKTYAMTGWRIGWMIAPREVAKACDTMQGQVTTNTTAVAQAAALAALEGDQAPVEAMRRAFEERRDAMVDGLNAIPGVRCLRPDGAFYAFADISGLYGKKTEKGTLTSDIEVAEWLLESARCAVVPGTPFGGRGHVRLSYATSIERVREGVARIKEAVGRLG